jgi:hypothetical protein
LSSASWKASIGFALQAGLHALQRVVDDRFGDGFLAVDHQVVHELGHHPVAILGIGQDFALFGGVTTGHLSVPHFGRFAPYFERR